MLDTYVDDFNLNKRWRDAVGEPIIVIINGVGGSGKDTFVQIIKNKLKTIENPDPFKNNKITTVRFEKDKVSIVKNISTIDNVRMAARLLGCDIYEKDDKCRRFLHELKKLSSEYYDTPYQKCRQAIYGGEYKICFVHCREPEEIQRFVDEFGAIAMFNIMTVLVRRPDIHTPDNPSDIGVENYKYDYVINNDGDYFSLDKKAVKFIRDIGLNEWRTVAVLD